MQELKKSGSVSLYAIAAVLCYLIINQGGYFAGGIISAGIIVSLMLLRVKVRVTTVDFVFMAFSAWYLFCSVRTGFNVRYIAKGVLPMLCLMFRFILPKEPEKAEELCRKLLKIAFYITIFAIFLCLYKSINSMRLRRLTFPFQYANGSGIFFGVMFILARYAGFEWAKKRQYVFFAGLVLTQSVGAIGLTVLAEIFLSRNRKKTLLMIAVLLVGAVVLRGRVYQSIGTFIERFLQMYDGFVCMLHNPVFGIGAGRWELYKNLYQSGFYDAKEIHSSVFQIAADSGVVGIGLFVASIVCALRSVRFENKVYLAGVLMVLCHSFLDFTLTFTLFGFLVMVLLSCGKIKTTKTYELKIPVTRVIFAIMAVGFTVLGTGMYQIKKLDGIDISKNYPRYISYYESHILSQKSIGTTENYAKALYATGEREKCLTVLENIDVLSADMIVLKKGCTNDWREVVNQLEIQAYNPVLYKTVCYNSDDEALQKEAEEMLDEAIDSMSFLGKILFDFKGEKIL